MPILHVRALPQKKPERVAHALKQTAQAIADAYDCPVEHVWVTWEDIKPGFYLEGNRIPQEQPESTHPPIAQLICFEGKHPEQIEAVLVAAARALGEGLGIPGNIFMSYLEVRSGQVIAGNGIVRKE
jgi:hypothetical protein